MASFNFQSGFYYQGMSLIINTNESVVPDLQTTTADWFANLYLITSDDEWSTWQIDNKIGYAKLDSTGTTVLGVNWLLSVTQRHTARGYQSSARYDVDMSHGNTSYTFSESEFKKGCATVESSVGQYLLNYPDATAYGITGAYNLSNINFTSLVMLTRQQILTAMGVNKDYNHLCIQSSAPCTTSGIPRVDLTSLNTYGFGWLIEGTSYVNSLKVKVRENNEHKWKGVTSAYVNVVEYDDEDEPIGHFWKPITDAKVVRNERWKSLQTGTSIIPL